MAKERIYVISYDIADPKRWHRIYRLMRGYGHWCQLSVFQCRLTARRRAEVAARIEQVIHHGEDHVLIFDLGPADNIATRVESLGKDYHFNQRSATII